MLRSALGISAGIFGAALIVHVALEHLSAWINVSDSLPLGIYQTEKAARPYVKGDLVLSCVPGVYADFAFDRGYISSGRCSARTAPVGKYIAAEPGDRVLINEQGVYVNGTRLEHSQPALRDGEGRHLLCRHVDKVLAEGEYILLNPKVSSFDSRYFGIVDEKLLIARLKVLLTLPEQA